MLSYLAQRPRPGIVRGEFGCREFAALAAFCFTLKAGTALAAGVGAGTIIESTATATYSTGAYSGSVTSNTSSVRVDEVLDVAVAGPSGSTVLAGSDPVALAFSITNTGNGPEAFRLTVTTAIAGNSFDAVLDQVVLDSNGNGTFDSGVDQVLAAGADTPLIAADSSRRVFVLLRLPAGTTDGQTGSARLTAAAVTGTGTPGTVFAGQGAGGGDAVVGASGAQSNATAELAASIVAVTLTKAAAIKDQFGGTRPVPGATITYQLTASVSGTGQIQSLQITDTIPTGTTYQSGSLKLDNAALTDAADSDEGTGGGGGISVTIPTATGGIPRIVSFDVKIN